jgi:hypothetical protein
MAFWSGLFGKRDSKPNIETPPVSIANLRVQVFRDDYVGVKLLDREGCAVRTLAPGLVEAIVEDLGGGERTMRWEYLRSFGKTDDELFDLARAQASTSTTEIASELLDGIEVMIANSFYLSAFMLETFRKRDLKKGVLVAPISWHHWCAHIIGDLTVAPHVQMMRFLAQSIASQMTVTDAERLTTSIYWIKPGGRVLERIEMDRDEPVLSAELRTTLESFTDR